MQYTIWKYKIEPSFENQIYPLPAGAVILSFGLDSVGALCFWARVNESAPLENHVLACVGTGWSLDAAFNDRLGKYAVFVGTTVQGDYVWHLFDLGAGADQEIFELAPQSGGREAGAHETNNSDNQ